MKTHPLFNEIEFIWEDLYKFRQWNDLIPFLNKNFPWVWLCKSTYCNSTEGGLKFVQNFKSPKRDEAIQVKQSGGNIQGKNWIDPQKNEKKRAKKTHAYFFPPCSIIPSLLPLRGSLIWGTIKANRAKKISLTPPPEEWAIGLILMQQRAHTQKARDEPFWVEGYCHSIPYWI